MNKIFINIGFLILYLFFFLPEVYANFVANDLHFLQRDISEDTVSFVGKRISGEQKTWIDDSTGFEITKWTSIKNNNHPYFTVESFIDEETALIFSDRSGKKQLYKLNLSTGEMIQMTNALNLETGGIYFLKNNNMVYYLDGKILNSLNVESLNSTFIFDFSQFKYNLISFSVTCDAQYLVFSANQKEQSIDDPGYGPFAIYKFNLEDKTITQVTMDYGFNISHVQTNPVYPDLILYCWQWEKPGRSKIIGHSPIRIWWVKLDGSDGSPIPQEYGTQRTHETWSPNGEYISYVSKYRWGPKRGEQFFGIQSIDGSTNRTYEARVSPAHQNLFKDNKHLIVDLYDDKPLLALIKFNEKEIENVRILFNHGSTLVEQDSHPHPRISPNGKYVLFSSDRTGSPQVYTVKINLEKQ